MVCTTCSGTGKFPNLHSVCPVCKGRGQLPNDRQSSQICLTCSGTGKFPSLKEICPVCEGRGRIPTESEGPMVIFIEAGSPRTAHIELKVLFGKLQGLVRICDPYYGTGSLLRLDLLTHCASVRFLTKNPDSKEKLIIGKAITEFVAQYPQFEFRTHLGGDLHDRFVLTDRELIILGHGMKDIGGKDSFIIILKRELANDIIDQVKESFDQKWSKAAQLP
jgi:hypothetical protein